MKFIVLALATLVLAACDPTPEQQAKVRAALPPGCTVQDVGEYGSINHLVIVNCIGHQTRTQNFMERHGKTSTSNAIVQID